MATQSIHATKTCTKCGVEKPADYDNFVKKLNGLAARCKPCLRADKNAVWAGRADAINAARRASRDADTREKDRQRYAAKGDRIRETARLRHLANPDKRRKRDRDQYRDRPEIAQKKKDNAAKWASENVERNRRNSRDFFRRKRATDPQYRLRSAVSAYVYWCLKGGRNGRRTFDLLGYTADDLRHHLERQFVRGMSWDNYGDWHVDHIVPVASFKFASPEDADFKACWAITNLRPLWAGDNIAKSDKRTLLL